MTARENRVSRLIVGDYPALEVAFRAAVSDFKSRFPLRPLVAVVPSHLLGLHLSRSLAEHGTPHVNLRFMTQKDLAESLTAPELTSAGKTPAPNFACEALIGEIVTELSRKSRGFYFGAIAERPGFHEAILGTINDLKNACVTPGDLKKYLRDSRTEGACHPGKLRDVLKVWSRYESRMKDLRWHDDADRDEMASRCASKSSLVRRASVIALYGFYDLSEVQKKTVKACFDANSMVAFVPFTTGRSFDYARPMIRWLRSQGFDEVKADEIAAKETDKASGGASVNGAGRASGRCKAKGAGEARSAGKAGGGGSAAGGRVPHLETLCNRLFRPTGAIKNMEDSLVVLSAPGEVREVREIVRHVSEAVREQGFAPHEIAILTRRSHPYTTLLRDAMTGMDVTPYILEGMELSETRAGRSIRLLIEILRNNFSRSSVMEFVTFAEIDFGRFFSGPCPADPAAIWDIVSMEAGIVDGSAEWESHLKGHLGELRSGRGDYPYREDVVKGLLKFIRELARSLGAVRKAKTWRQAAERLARTVADLIEPDEFTEGILQSIRSLSMLDDLGTEPGGSDFFDLIDDVLSGSAESTGKFQRNGPAVLSLIAARGIPFKMVILPGMVEKFFPAPARQDAILLDAERQALNRCLSGTDTEPIHLRGAPQLDRERLFYRLAMGAAREKLMLTYPRLDIGTARERVPSSFVLATIEAALGSRVDFDVAENFRGFRRIPLAQLGADQPRKALNEAEFDIAVASGDIAARRPDAFTYLQATADLFRRALELETSRWEDRTFTAYDGILSGEKSIGHLRADHSIVGKSVGPTRLETYACCPYRYYLENILRLEALVEPEREETVSPLDRGAIIHSVLWKFFTDLRTKRGEVPFALKPDDVDLLHATLSDKLLDFERGGITGHPLMWDMEKTDIALHLDELFDEEIERQAQDPTGHFPAYFEVRYGMKPRDDEESDISVEYAVPLPFGKRKVSIRGRIDRIDLTRDLRSARIVDYKTGRSKPNYKDNDLMQGESLQLALYLKAAYEILNRIHDEVAVDYAEDYSIAHTGRKRHIRFEYKELLAKREELTLILNTIADGIEAGIFFAYPGGACDYCDYGMICGGPGEREAVFTRKMTDKRIAAFRSMKGDDPDG